MPVHFSEVPISNQYQYLKCTCSHPAAGPWWGVNSGLDLRILRSLPQVQGWPAHVYRDSWTLCSTGQLEVPSIKNTRLASCMLVEKLFFWCSYDVLMLRCYCVRRFRCSDVLLTWFVSHSVQIKVCYCCKISLLLSFSFL